jgi:CubicO group peptidase (beta-lactamase class C family)
LTGEFIIKENLIETLKNYKSIFLAVLLLAIIIVFNTCSETGSEQQDLFSDYEPYKWEEALPENVGIDPELIELAVGKANDLDYLHSLLVVKDGKLVVEYYFDGYKPEEPHIVRSVSKSFLSVFVGLAIREGYIHNINEKIINYIPEYEVMMLDERMKEITIKDILTMRSGMKRDRDFYSAAFMQSNNWVQTILNEELISPPGEQYNYSTPSTHILALVLQNALGGDLIEFTDRHLFSKIGIELADWEKDPQGNCFGGNNMYFVPRDLARFGYVIMYDGMVGDENIVPSEWLNESMNDTRNQQGITWGTLTDIGYGYLWWLGKLNGYETQLAIGHGGQFIIMIKELDLLIVTTAEAYEDWDQADVQERGVLSLVSDYVMQAID